MRLILRIMRTDIDLDSVVFFLPANAVYRRGNMNVGIIGIIFPGVGSENMQPVPRAPG